MDDGFGLYLNDIGKYPLLTAEEERELAQIMEAGHEAEERLEAVRSLGSAAINGSLNEESAQSELTKDEQELLPLQVHAGEKAKERFINSNLRLVVSIARRYPLPQGMDLLDLIQEGNLGLEHAVDKFDHRKGFKFSTYATFWIRQAIGRALDQKGSLIRLPGDRSSSLRAALRAQLEDGRQLDNERDALHRLTTPVSLDKNVGDEGDATMGDLMASSLPGPEESLMSEVDNDLLNELLGTLDRRARYAVKARFGFLDGERKSYREIGENLGVTAEASRRLVSRAVASLRDDAESTLGISGKLS